MKTHAYVKEFGQMLEQFDRPSRWLDWACKIFGEKVARDPHERAMRLLEEAIELGHALGLDASVIQAITTRVYAQPRGDVRREIAQTLGTLEVLACALGIDADKEAYAELARVMAIPKEEWDRRQAAKVAIGIAK